MAALPARRHEVPNALVAMPTVAPRVVVAQITSRPRHARRALSDRQHTPPTRSPTLPLPNRRPLAPGPRSSVRLPLRHPMNPRSEPGECVLGMPPRAPRAQRLRRVDAPATPPERVPGLLRRPPRKRPHAFPPTRFTVHARAHVRPPRLPIDTHPMPRAYPPIDRPAHAIAPDRHRTAVSDRRLGSRVLGQPCPQCPRRCVDE